MQAAPDAPGPLLFFVRPNGNIQPEPLEVNWTEGVTIGRSAETADAYPPIYLEHVSRVSCLLEVKSTAPLEISLTNMSTSNGTGYSHDGITFFKLNGTDSVLLGAGDRIAVDRRFKHLSTFEIGSASILIDEMQEETQLYSQDDDDAMDTASMTPASAFDYLPHEVLLVISQYMSPLSTGSLMQVSSGLLSLFEHTQHDFVRRRLECMIVCGNDPIDGAGIRNVLLAAHSRGVADRMLKNAFAFLTSTEVINLIQHMECFDVFSRKNGGKKAEAIADARSATRLLIEYVEGYYDEDGEWVDGFGDNTILWGSGGGADRVFVQSSMQTGWVEPLHVRPLNFMAKPSEWDRIGVLKTLDWIEMELRNRANRVEGPVNSINLLSSDNGTGTYLVELWRHGQLKHSFMLGIYPHPGSLSWGSVENRPHEHAKLLRDLVLRTPSQMHIIQINADDFD